MKKNSIMLVISGLLISSVAVAQPPSPGGAGTGIPGSTNGGESTAPGRQGGTQTNGDPGPFVAGTTGSGGTSGSSGSGGESGSSARGKQRKGSASSTGGSGVMQ